MTIQWLGHACFRITSGDYAVVIDPYADGKVPGLRPLNVTANAVLCSHGHDDHNAAHLVKIVRPDAPSPFTITRVATAHDNAGGTLRGMNTIHVLGADGVRVAHLGDLGHPLTAEQIAAIGPLNAVMIPIGGYYTIDAESAKAVVDALKAAVVLPMHYRSEAFGFPVIGTLGAFTGLCDDVAFYDRDTIEIVPDMPPKVAMLTYQ